MCPNCTCLPFDAIASRQGADLPSFILNVGRTSGILFISSQLLACLRLLLTLRSPLDSGWQQEEDAVAASLCFVMCGEQEACDDITETSFSERSLESSLFLDDNSTQDGDAFCKDDTSHSEIVLLWELRAMCHRYQAKHAAQEARRRAIKDGAASLTKSLWSGALAVDSGLARSTRFVTNSLLAPAGDWICQNTDAASEGMEDKSPDNEKQ